MWIRNFPFIKLFLLIAGGVLCSCSNDSPNKGDKLGSLTSADIQGKWSGLENDTTYTFLFSNDDFILERTIPKTEISSISSGTYKVTNDIIFFKTTNGESCKWSGASIRWKDNSSDRLSITSQNSELILSPKNISINPGFNGSIDYEI